MGGDTMSCWMCWCGMWQRPAARCQEKPKPPALCQGARGAICCSCTGHGSPHRDLAPAAEGFTPSLASLASPRAWAEPNPWVTSALTASSNGIQPPLQRENALVPGNFVFIMNKCPPAPLERVGKWEEGNSGNESIPTTLHPDRHVLSTSQVGQNP